MDPYARSAGFPDGARVRVHPESVGRLELPAQVIGDDRLELGDVHIDVPGAGVGADLSTRAALLVAAAAQA